MHGIHALEVIKGQRAFSGERVFMNKCSSNTLRTFFYVNYDQCNSLFESVQIIYLNLMNSISQFRSLTRGHSIYCAEGQET